MNEMETTGRTSSEAIEKALQTLGKTRAEVEVEIVRESSGGFFDRLLHGPARVRVRVRGAAAKDQPPPAAQPQPRGRQSQRERETPKRGDTAPAAAAKTKPPAERAASPPHDPRQRRQQARPDRGDDATPDPPVSARGAANLKEARDILLALLRHMHIDAEVKLREDPAARTLYVDLGAGASVLIGRKGNTLQAFEFLLGRILNGEEPRWANIIVDVDDYRRLRSEQVAAKARELAARVRRDGKPLQSEPLPAQERRLFHLAIKEEEGVESKSYGNDLLRRIMVYPAGQEPQPPPPRRPRRQDAASAAEADRTPQPRRDADSPRGENREASGAGGDEPQQPPA